MAGEETKRSIRIMGARIDVIAVSEETSGQFGCIEMELPPNFPGPPRHYHEKMVEFFYVLEGTVDVFANGEERRLSVGESVTVPTGVVHGFANRSDRPARFLAVGQGLDRFLIGISEWMARSPEWPPKDPAQLAEFNRSHDVLYT